MTSNQMAAALAAALALVEQKQTTKTRKGKGQKRVKLTEEQKAVNAQANAAAAEKMFTDAGFKDCQAHVTIKTYGKWEEAGRRVKKGEKALRNGNGPALFHLSQTEEIVKSN